MSRDFNPYIVFIWKNNHCFHYSIELRYSNKKFILLNILLSKFGCGNHFILPMTPFSVVCCWSLPALNLYCREEAAMVVFSFTLPWTSWTLVAGWSWLALSPGSSSLHLHPSWKRLKQSPVLTLRLLSPSQRPAHLPSTLERFSIGCQCCCCSTEQVPQSKEGQWSQYCKIIIKVCSCV